MRTILAWQDFCIWRQICCVSRIKKTFSNVHFLLDSIVIKQVYKMPQRLRWEISVSSFILLVASSNTVHLIWVPSPMEYIGKERAESLSKPRPMSAFIDSQTWVPISPSEMHIVFRDELVVRLKLWVSCKEQRQARQLARKPFCKRARVLSISKTTRRHFFMGFWLGITSRINTCILQGAVRMLSAWVALFPSSTKIL